MTNTDKELASYKCVANGDLVGQYLNEISRLPLLTSEQEISYGRAVQMMMSLHSFKQALAAKLHREPTLLEWAASAGDLQAELLTDKIIQGEQAKKKMVEGNLRLVVSVAKKYQHRGVELIDLIQYGSLGLQQAVERFDPTLGYKFSTYAIHWIKQGITQAIANHSRTIRLPVHLNSRLSKIKRIRVELAQKLGRSPQITEISQEMGLKVELILECLLVSRSLVSLSLLCGTEKNDELLTLLPACQPSPEDLTEADLFRQQVLDLLNQLNPRQKEVICLRFGLYSERALTCTETAAFLKMSYKTARQIEARALRQLRKVCVFSDSWDIEALSQLCNQ